MNRFKGVIIVLDGLGDRPSAELDGLTPLEAAATPTLDALARRGSGGIMYPLHPWVPVGTQTGIGLLMGLARSDVDRLRRGPVEAAGVGLEITPNDVAVRCNIATLERTSENFAIVDRRAGRRLDGIIELLQALDGQEIIDGITVNVKAATEHRVVALLTGASLSSAITDTDPGSGSDQLGVLRSFPVDTSPEAARTSEAVNAMVERSFEVFDHHPVNRARRESGLLPANGLITRGAGSLMSVRNLVSHLGLRAAVVTGERTAVGLGRIFGFTIVNSKLHTGRLNTDVEAKVTAVNEALEDHDLVFLHFKGADLAAHDLNPVGKRDFLHRIDRAIRELPTSNLVIGVTGDHSTSSTSGRHTGDPVPTLVAGPESRIDEIKRFGERWCVQGGLGQMSATSFLTCCLDQMGVLSNYRPGQEPFFE